VQVPLHLGDALDRRLSLHTIQSLQNIRLCLDRSAFKKRCHVKGRRGRAGDPTASGILRTPHHTGTHTPTNRRNN
jgi:hypothetical protein